MGNITFLGVEGSGKTVLTMALVNAFKAHEHEGWFLRPETLSAFRFIEQVPTELKEGTLPHQTTALRHLAWSVVKDGEHQQTLDVLDYPGEIYRLAFIDAKDSADSVNFLEQSIAHKEDVDSLLKHLFESDHVFVLFNLSDARDLATNSRNLDAVWVTNACLDYLHRLPHKPCVTLLLTQIDRYVDLEQHEFDPKIYFNHHLSLLAHNFPNLDVRAVAALGSAESTYGINTVLVRCLVNVPVVQDAINHVKECRRDLEYRFGLNVKDEAFCSQVVNAVENLSCDALHWKQKLPWFINVKDLINSTGMLSAEACQECKTIVDKYRAVLQACDGNTIDYSYLASLMCEMEAKSEEASLLVQKMYSQFHVAELKACRATLITALKTRQADLVVQQVIQQAAKIEKCKCYASRSFLIVSVIILLATCIVVFVCA